MCPCASMAIYTMFIRETYVMSATVKERSPTEKCIESILISNSMRSRSIRATTKSKHCIPAEILPIRHQCRYPRLWKHISKRKVFHFLTFRQRGMILKTKPGKISRLSHKSFTQQIRFLLQNTPYIIGTISIVY